MLKNFIKFKNDKSKDTEKGFSLVEMLVSTFVFSIMIGTIAGLFISGVQGQRSILAQQKVIDEASYIMEYMSRALRMGEKNGNSFCGGSGDNYSPSGDSMTFRNVLEEDSSGDPECQTFSLSGGKLMRQVDGIDVALTSDKIEVVDLNFVVSGDILGEQPMVTISMQVKGVGARPEQQKIINLQTTVSQRNLNE